MNAQEVFTKVATHLLTQGKKSEATMPDKHSECMYRGDGGASCAVGCLISDEAYDSKLESSTEDNYCVRVALRQSGVDDEVFELVNDGYTLLKSLQLCHDKFEPSTWRFRLYVLARNFGLIMPTVAA